MTNARLARRLNTFKPAKGTKRPGSENRHKSAPAGGGRRAAIKVRSDSRDATRG